MNIEAESYIQLDFPDPSFYRFGKVSMRSVNEDRPLRIELVQLADPDLGGGSLNTVAAAEEIFNDPPSRNQSDWFELYGGRCLARSHNDNDAPMRLNRFVLNGRWI